jgi:hypothetical protein
MGVVSSLATPELPAPRADPGKVVAAGCDRLVLVPFLWQAGKCKC